ncbi:MAG: quinone-dependent dihydroorotate dehydrogenase [Bacteroidetes bacterium]|nr:quinone-dependent dihydroorotate dehydrogenase [Bacteroidota bacterium]
MIYPILRNLLFNFPAEEVHYFSMNNLHRICATSIGRSFLQSQFSVTDKSLEKDVFGLLFSNPVGLGAGFDKNASYLKELACLGFGFVEIGTVTPKAQDGNDKPRVFRLPKDKGLINRMGFNNQGAQQAKQRLIEWNNTKTDQVGGKMIVGGNIGKNKVTPNEDAWKDYEICFRELFETVDYFVVNVSSPNTPGLRELQEKDSLTKILANLQNINQGKASPKPLLLKIAPDLTEEQLADIVALSFETKLSGLVATNTTISRANLITDTDSVTAMGAGGLSGKPVTARATEVVSYLHKNTNGQIPIIASGGIFTGPDAKEKLDAGAALVQVWTGFIYEGPAIVKNICQYLAANQ